VEGFSGLDFLESEAFDSDRFTVLEELSERELPLSFLDSLAVLVACG
jgi:hypothetical protein